MLLNRKIINSLLVLLCLCGDAFPRNSYEIGEVRADYPKGCAYLRCKRGDQCVNRKFWCKNPPCPSMLYCSKSRKESLKGPASCDAVRCSKGFVCLVRARRCRWGEACEQQIARCVSEREYYEGPASCADFRCPSGHRCILRESLCGTPPCKLLKSCANTKDVNSWFDGCKSMGCLSEHECFLRRPPRDCTNPHCKHKPDCLATSEEEFETNEPCRGWVCPKGQECSTHTEGPCKRDVCRISRSCHKPLMLPLNSTRPRKHSWKDDVKLSFYSKLEKNSPGMNVSSPRLSTNKISRGSSHRNTKIPTITNVRKIHERPIYKSPVYVSSISKSTTTSPSSVSPDYTSGRNVQPTVTSLSTWLDHLKLKTGVDAIEVWMKKAEKQESYGEFREWLESVKDMLGTAAYDLWLEEVRSMTVTSPAFQKWLPPAPTKLPPSTHHFFEPDRDFLDLNEKLHPELQNSAKYRTNEDNDYSQRGNINGRGYESESIKNDDFKEEDFIFPPRMEPPTMKPEITLNNVFPTAEYPPSPTLPNNDWSQFYPPDPRIIQQSYPFPQNFGNIAPWTNQQSPYQGYDPSSIFNPWYQQFPSNWSFQQPPMRNPEFLRPNPWQDQFVPPMIPQWSQERDSRDQFQFPMDRTEQTPDILHRFIEEPIQYYPRNASSEEDPPWMKYFTNSQENSQFEAPDSFGSFPMNDGNFDGYISWPGSSNQGRSSADVPHRRSKHDDSKLGHFRFPDKDEDRSGKRLKGIAENPEVYSSGFPWPFADPRFADYYRYLMDYNRRNLYDRNPSSPIVPNLSRSHRVEFEAPNRFFAENGRKLPAENQAVRTRENERKTDPFPKANMNDFDEDRRGGLLFRNRNLDGKPIGVPDMWDPKYRSSLSSFVNKIDDMKEKIVPIVPSRRRVALSWKAPIVSKNLPRLEDEDYREDYSVGDEEDPMLMNLQGYIESDEENSMERLKNSTILPVYTSVEDTQGQDDCINYSAGPSEDFDNPPSFPLKATNFFKNPKYGGNPNFPKYLKSVFDVEGATIMRNMTGEKDVEIKGIKWEYEDEAVEKFVEDPTSFPEQRQAAVPPTEGLSNINQARDWTDNKRGERYDGGSENYYYDDGIDYDDDILPEDRSYSDLDQINDPLDYEEIGDDSTDRSYSDSDHKRFKKNRPL